MDFKRSITPKQISELTPKQLERLKEWWKPQDGDYFIKAVHGYNSNSWYKIFSYGNTAYNTKTNAWIPLLDIGQMIELVGEHEIMIITLEDAWGHSNVSLANKGFAANNLCDALWQAVKEVLDKEDITNKTMTECGADLFKEGD